MKKVKEGLAEARQSPMSIETLVHWFSQNIEVTPQEVDRETFEQAQATEIVQETKNGKICLVPPNPSWQDLKKITTSLRASELDDASRKKYEKIHEAEYDFLRKVAKYLADLDTDKLKGSKKILYEEIKDFFAEIGSFAQNQKEINLTEEDKAEIESFLLGRNIYEKQKARFESRKAEGKIQEPWEKLMAKKLEKVLNILSYEKKDSIMKKVRKTIRKIFNKRDSFTLPKRDTIESIFSDGLTESVKPKTEFVQTPHDIGTEQLLQDTESLSLCKGLPPIKEIIKENISTEGKIRKIVSIIYFNFRFKIT